MSRDVSMKSYFNSLFQRPQRLQAEVRHSLDAQNWALLHHQHGTAVKQGGGNSSPLLLGIGASLKALHYAVDQSRFLLASVLQSFAAQITALTRWLFLFATNAAVPHLEFENDAGWWFDLCFRGAIDWLNDRIPATFLDTSCFPFQNCSGSQINKSGKVVS